MCQEPDNKTDPATPAPTSECSLLENASKEHVPAKTLSIDESFSSIHEPLSPDSCCHVDSPIDSPKGKRCTKKQRVSMEGAHSLPEMVFRHQILESSMSSYQQPNEVFLAQEQFGPSLGLSARSDKASEQNGYQQ